jgi:hypothetical protein
LLAASARQSGGVTSGTNSGSIKEDNDNVSITVGDSLFPVIEAELDRKQVAKSGSALKIKRPGHLLQLQPPRSNERAAAVSVQKEPRQSPLEPYEMK